MVKVGFLEDEPIILAATGVKISQTPFEEGSILDLYNKCRKDRKKSKELVNSIMRNHGHMILADFLPYAITLEDLSRFAAIYLWQKVNAGNLVFGAGIEASLRVIRPNRFCKILKELGKEAFGVYQKAIRLGVKEQDARYVLPEGTLTRMIFSAPPRYLIKIAADLKKAPLKELQEIGKKIINIVKEKFKLQIPEEDLPCQWSFWGRKKIKQGIWTKYQNSIYSLSLDMGIRGSLAMYAQLVRQRQILCNIEPLEGIAYKSRFVIPPNFSKSLKKEYKEIAKKAKAKQMELIKKKDPNFVYFLLLGQEAEAEIYGKGFQIIETSKARSEGVAQWEIRNTVGIPITRELAKYPFLKKKIGPRCWREGRCIEPQTFKTKKNICKAFSLSKGKWQGSLEQLLQVLTEPCHTFRV